MRLVQSTILRSLLVVQAWASKTEDEPPLSYVCDPLPAEFQRHGRTSEEPWPLCAPHFIVGGTEKGGTTSFYEYLKAHPDFLPVSGTFIFPREIRAKIIRALAVRANNMEKNSGVPPEKWGQDNRHDRKRWLRLSNLTKEEVENAPVPKGKMLSRDLKFPELESHAIPIRLGKEVRYWSIQLSKLIEELGLTQLQGYEGYANLFDAIPAPLPRASQSAHKGSPLARTWDSTRNALEQFGLSESSTMPASLQANLYKVSGEASPQYLERSSCPDCFRLVICTVRFMPQNLLQVVPELTLVFSFVWIWCPRALRAWSKHGSEWDCFGRK